MQAEITAHVLRLKNNNEIVDVESIQDMYSEVCVKFYATQVSEEQLIDWLKAVWGSRWAKNGSNMLESYHENGYFHIQGEAKDIPCIGNYLSCIETKVIDNW
jgi:hypothetical protein